MPLISYYSLITITVIKYYIIAITIISIIIIAATHATMKAIPLNGYYIILLLSIRPQDIIIVYSFSSLLFHYYYYTYVIHIITLPALKLRLPCQLIFITLHIIIIFSVLILLSLLIIVNNIIDTCHIDNITYCFFPYCLLFSKYDHNTILSIGSYSLELIITHITFHYYFSLLHYYWYYY